MSAPSARSRWMRTANKLLLCLLLATPGLANEVITVDFDDVSAPGPFAFIVPGLANGPLLEYEWVTLDGAVILTDALFGNGATSEPNIYATCDTCGLGDGPPPTTLPGYITGELPLPVARIECDVYNGSTGSSASFTLTGFDVDGQVVAADTVVLTPMHTAGFTGHLAIEGADIVRFEVTTDHDPGYSFAIDTLVLEVAGVGTPFCTSTPNSSGSAAVTGALGSASVGTNGLRLLASGLPAGQPGIFFYGPNEVQVPFGNGVRCVGGGSLGLFRLPPGAAGNAGVLQLEPDLQSPPSGSGSLAGSTWKFQAWFRDPSGGGAAFDLARGLSIDFGA